MHFPRLKLEHYTSDCGIINNRIPSSFERSYETAFYASSEICPLTFYFNDIVSSSTLEECTVETESIIATLSLNGYFYLDERFFTVVE